MENRINYTSAYGTVNSIALSANGEYLIVGTESHIRFLRYKLPPVALIEDINRESLRFDSMITFTGSVIYNYGDFNIYEWNYKSAPNSRYRGVMAQEVMKVVPEAVYVEEDGFLGVYYDLIDVDMAVINS